jgi:quercetin dioxygenase-like cupin family protein
MMKSSRTASIATAALVLAIAALAAPAAWAQAQGLTAKPLLRTTLTGDDTKEAVIVTAELAPGATTGRHTHPGDEYTVVLQGTLEVRLEGHEPKRVGAGEAYHNPKGVIHETRNVGDGPARVSITFIIDKGKPITQPAP